MAFSWESGHRTLWVSDPLEEMIYQIDMDPTGIEEGQSGSLEGVSLSVSSNPVAGAAVFTGAGFAADAVIEVYGVSGRLLLREPFDGTFTWSGTPTAFPAGVYVAVVRDGSGGTAVLRVTRLAI